MRHFHAVTNTPARAAILPPLIALLLAAIMPATRGHFVFVIPDEKGTKVTVILSETLEVDEDIDPELVDGVKLVTRDGAVAEGFLNLARDGGAICEAAAKETHAVLTNTEKLPPLPIPASSF